MPSVIKSVSFDAADALALARFWAAALGSDVDEDSTAELPSIRAIARDIKVGAPRAKAIRAHLATVAAVAT